MKPNPHKSTGSKSEGKKKLPIDKDAKKSAASALESSGMARESVPEQGNSFEVEGKENSPVNSDRESVGGSGQKDETDQLGKVSVVSVISHVQKLANICSIVSCPESQFS